MWCVLGRHPKGCVLKDNRSRLQGFHGVYFGCRAGEIRYNCAIYIVVLSIWWITLPIHPEHLAYPLLLICVYQENLLSDLSRNFQLWFLKQSQKCFLSPNVQFLSLVKALRGIRWVTLIAKAGVPVQFNKLWIAGPKNCLNSTLGLGIRVDIYW